MKIIADLAAFIKNEAKGACEYAKMAEKYKFDNKELSDTFISLATTELEHLERLHAWIVKFIAQQKASGKEIPQGMLDVWEYQHSEMVDELARTKNILEMAKKR